MAMFRISDSKQFIGTTVFYVHIQCYLDLTEHIFSSCWHWEHNVYSCSSPEYHCCTLVVVAMNMVVVMCKLSSIFPWMRTYSMNVSKKINKKDLHGVGYIPFIKTTLCIFWRFTNNHAMSFNIVHFCLVQSVILILICNQTKVLYKIYDWMIECMVSRTVGPMWKPTYSTIMSNIKKYMLLLKISSGDAWLWITKQ
jgi:hypothetical protein